MDQIGNVFTMPQLVDMSNVKDKRSRLAKRESEVDLELAAEDDACGETACNIRD